MDTSETYYEMCSKAFPKDAKRGIYLKTQDQLQEMLATLESPLEIAIAFGEWCRELFLSDLSWINASMEALWLAYVMKSVYQKIWSGTEWIKET